MIICPKCGKTAFTQIHRSPIEPAEDRFRCNPPCGHEFNRYDPPQKRQTVSGSMIKEKLVEIEKLREKQSILLDQLRLWAEVKDQGINENDVESFGFDPDLLDKAEQRTYRDAIEAAAHGCSIVRGPEWAGRWVGRSGAPEWFNCVILKDGQKVRLDPILRAAKKE